ncbi:alkaline ceramidase-like [Salvia divinorum]|uniref:Alkaline ceramidase-like n=1 Tax=Salvia divinorum TaxID=28513 RepID=A0ABD1GFV8_SALDI
MEKPKNAKYLAFVGLVEIVQVLRHSLKRKSHLSEIWQMVCHVSVVLSHLHRSGVSRITSTRLILQSFSIPSRLLQATTRRQNAYGVGNAPVYLHPQILYSPDWHYRSAMPTFLFLYGAVFAVAHSLVRFHVGFKVHCVLLCLLCAPRMYKYYILTEERSAK